MPCLKLMPLTQSSPGLVEVQTTCAPHTIFAAVNLGKSKAEG